MRVLTKNELDQASGGITCTLNPNPINLSELAMAAASGAMVSPHMALILAGANYVSQSWICRF
ncbi:hypothetical protein [Burkholderia sp. MSMB1835]|uniref:hypothetical protein n=1 Tax=Burkholderia sp. MSMB1835 TaxID=1637876 RepID=UPI0009EC17E7|nr:hypothetical protein [Burkholderia sp. MSMB1835]